MIKNFLFIFIFILFLFNRHSFGQIDSIDSKFDLYIIKGDSCLLLKNYDCVLFNYGKARKLKPHDKLITNIFNSIIITSFDKIEYFPDSTIKSAFLVKKGLPHGYSVEFDSIGSPIKIGKYKNGVKNGRWILNNGEYIIYRKGQQWQAIKLHWIRSFKSQEKFEKLYLKLLSRQR